LLALLVIAALFVVRPLLYTGEPEGEMDSAASHWLAERERVLDALAELEADWELGKVPGEVYAEQRALLVAKGALALEELEKTQKGHRPKNKTIKTGKAKNDDLEALITAYKAKRRGRK
jgi:hypothetical protein